MKASDTNNVPELIFFSRSLGIYGDATARYVPPHLRQNKDSKKQGNERLRKQVKGLLNRYVYVVNSKGHNYHPFQTLKIWIF